METIAGEGLKKQIYIKDPAEYRAAWGTSAFYTEIFSYFILRSFDVIGDRNMYLQRLQFYIKI